MPSKIEIWNMALGFIGTRTVASEAENTQESIQCKLFWDNARRQALRDYPWNFSQRRAWLAAVPVPSGWELEYSHAYALPEDCLKCLRLLANGDRETRFILSHDVERGGTILLASAPKALLVYTADVQHVNMFDDLFQSVMARKLAALICVPLLKNNSGKISELEQLYQVALKSAFEANSSEGEEQEKTDTWLSSRDYPEAGMSRSSPLPAGYNGVSGIPPVGGGTGNPGPEGPEGPPGPAGQDGKDGEAGPQGEVGPAGTPGRDGQQGIPGLNGKSAYQLWLDAGNTGSEEAFMESLKGEAYTLPIAKIEDINGPAVLGGIIPDGTSLLVGDNGVASAVAPKGDPGIDGPTGPAGPAGPTGPEGPAGPAGQDGKDGPAGPEGPEGPAGPAGADGAQGPPGISGPMPGEVISGGSADTDLDGDFILSGGNANTL